ncbi:hypothetical protein BX600DRAFT_440382 [Xylariales sp. PMI_506]|nr:hypothetical protein BX600DRAFT_440382 [Xylariales sp. PMI_506]
MDSTPLSSWDVHVHVFDPKRHPYIPNTRYSPPSRSTAVLINAMPTSNFVIVMSGPEGTNTDLTIEAMDQLRQMGREARGVVVIEAAIFDIDVWHNLIPVLQATHKEYSTLFVADHVFAAQPADIGSPKFRELLGLVGDGVLYVKISGLTRYGREPATMMPLVKEPMKRRNAERVVYGSDWPHVNSNPGSTSLLDVDLPHHLNHVKAACDELGVNTWERLMRDNAANLYR